MSISKSWVYSGFATKKVEGHATFLVVELVLEEGWAEAQIVSDNYKLIHGINRFLATSIELHVLGFSEFDT